MQIDIDRWHIDNKNKKYNQKNYEKFLKKLVILKMLAQSSK